MCSVHRLGAVARMWSPLRTLALIATVLARVERNVKRPLSYVTRGGAIQCVKPQKTRDVLRELRSQGWRRLRDAKGSHEIWVNAGGTAKVPVPAGHREISPGVVQMLERKGLEIPKEWM